MTIYDIQTIFKNCDFEELTESTVVNKVINRLPRDLEFTFFTGLTKVVFVFPGLDYVIKIPYFGATRETYQDYRYVNEFVAFEGAWDSGNGDDYCKAEMMIYQDALLSGVEQLFAPNELMCHLNGTPVYMQPLCEVYENCPHEALDLYTQRMIETTCEEKDFGCFNPEWLVDVLNYYGEDVLIAFLDFLEDNNITDLHDGNLGYHNGAPVLIDYGGFEWQKKSLFITF